MGVPESASRDAVGTRMPATVGDGSPNPIDGSRPGSGTPRRRFLLPGAPTTSAAQGRRTVDEGRGRGGQVVAMLPWTGRTFVTRRYGR